VPEKMHTNKTEADGLQKQNKRRINRVALVTFKKKEEKWFQQLLLAPLKMAVTRDS
jgi:hypothetical protein